AEKVYLQDGARCLITPELINKIIEIMKTEKAAALAVKEKNTIKKAEDNGRVIETIPRENIWEMQTPQAFELELIKKALLYVKEKNIKVTDDCQAVELLGIKPLLVEGSYENIKITTPEDLAIAEAILRRRG
ncbi:MAG: 2-C-methyl-D-erythritol 4-phosphate cytidylyltransferase, partial [Candidatus Diapherotrites archaeon]|nr:2-C-methyl-D-erythritol 4-phosphate cytidylyltransferase [Candidatus Diapherotrites archaeon]